MRSPTTLFPILQISGSANTTSAIGGVQGLGNRTWREAYLDRIPSLHEDITTLGRGAEARLSIASLPFLTRATIHSLGLDRVRLHSFLLFLSNVYIA